MNEYPTIKFQLHKMKPALKQKFGVERIGFFDSYIDTNHHHGCELNILVEFSRPLGWDFFALKEYIENRLQMRIDICTPKALKPALKDEILAQTIFA